MATSTADPIRSEARLSGRLDVAFLLLDGVRRPRRSKSAEVALCALGLDRAGQPRPLALRIAAAEDERVWTELLRDLRAGGVGSHLLLVSCDGHPALLRAVRTVFPGTPVQISIAHRLLALAVKVETRWRPACLAEARAIFAAPDRDTAVAQFRAWRVVWLRDGYRAVQSLESDLASCLSFYRFPQSLWPRIRTVNLVERAFREARVAVFAPAAGHDAPEHGPAERRVPVQISATVQATEDELPSREIPYTIPRERSLAVRPAEIVLPLPAVRPAAHPNGAGSPSEVARAVHGAPASPNGHAGGEAVTVPDPAAGGDSIWWTPIRIRPDPRLKELALTVLAALAGLGLGLTLTLIL